MTGWEEDQKTAGSMIKLLGDPSSEFTKALDLVLDHPGPMSVLGNPRCKRFSMFVDDGVIKSVNVAEGEDDPAGDAAPEVSMVDKMLTDVAAGAHGRAPPAALGSFDTSGLRDLSGLRTSFSAVQPPKLHGPGAFQSMTRPLGATGIRAAPRAGSSYGHFSYAARRWRDSQT